MLAQAWRSCKTGRMERGTNPGVGFRVTKSYSFPAELAMEMDAAKEADPSINWTRVITSAIRGELTRWHRARDDAKRERAEKSARRVKR